MAVIAREAERQQESTAAGEKGPFLQRMSWLKLISPEKLPVAAQMDTRPDRAFKADRGR